MKVWAAEENSKGFKTPSLSEVFPDDWEDIKTEFDEFIEELKLNGECCIDSYRIAEAMDPNAMKLYDTFVTCCGSKDIGREVNGTLYMFGANYGH